MQPHCLIFEPSLDEYKQLIHWDVLDEDLKNSALFFYNKYNHSEGPVAFWKSYKLKVKDGMYFIDGHEFSGQVFSMLHDGQDIVVYVVSCGNLDNTSYADPLESFFSETLKRMACNTAMEYCRKKVANLLGSKVCSINPGSGESTLWPVSQLKELFNILKCDNLPVSILPSGLMYPIKSLAGVFFLNDSNFISCKYCSRENCPDRKPAEE